MFSSPSASASLSLRSQHSGWDRSSPTYVGTVEDPFFGDLGDLKATVEAGFGFGEQLSSSPDSSSSSKRPFSAAAIAPFPSIIVRVSSLTYNGSLAPLILEKRDLLDKVSMMGGVELFSGWTEESIERAARVAEKRVYGFNDQVTKVGDALLNVFVLVEGQCTLRAEVELPRTSDTHNLLDGGTRGNPNTMKVKVADVRGGALLGDIEIIDGRSTNTPYASLQHKATAIVKSHTCVLLALSTPDFVKYVLNAPNNTGDKIRKEAKAVQEFRKERLLKAMKKGREEKRDQEAEHMAVSDIARKLQQEITLLSPELNGRKAFTGVLSPELNARKAFTVQMSPGKVSPGKVQKEMWGTPNSNPPRKPMQPWEGEGGGGGGERGPRRPRLRTFAGPGDFRDFKDFETDADGQPDGLPDVWAGGNFSGRGSERRKLLGAESSKSPNNGWQPEKRRGNFGKKTAEVAERLKSDPFQLPGLRDNHTPSSPKTLRKIRGQSMTSAMLNSRHSATTLSATTEESTEERRRGGDDTPSPKPRTRTPFGFQHYGSALSSSLGDYNQSRPQPAPPPRTGFVAPPGARTLGVLLQGGGGGGGGEGGGRR